MYGPAPAGRGKPTGLLDHVLGPFLINDHARVLCKIPEDVGDVDSLRSGFLDSSLAKDRGGYLAGQ